MGRLKGWKARRDGGLEGAKTDERKVGSVLEFGGAEEGRLEDDEWKDEV